MLELEDVSLDVNGKSILCGLSLSVGENEIHGILGKNGTGKSTLAYLIMGVGNFSPTRGAIKFDGEDITHLPVSQRARKGIGLAWQEPARIEGLSVRDYLMLSGKRRGVKRVDEYLSIVGLEPGEYLERDIDNTLSGGERKRVEMASILAMHPRLAVLDEPDSGIDVLALPALLEAIAALKKGGSSVLLITHNEKVVDVADRVSVMCAGHILKTGRPDQMSQWFKDNCQPCLHVNEPKTEGEEA